MRAHAGSLTARLTLLFAAVSSGVLLGLGLLVATLVERHFEELDLALLHGKLELVRQELSAVRRAGAPDTLASRLETVLAGHPDLALTVWKADGQALFRTGDADFPSALRDRLSVEPQARWLGADGRAYRGIAGVAAVADAAPMTVVLATGLTHHEHFMQTFSQALWTVVALAALLSGLLGWMAVRRGLAPLREISRRAADITADRLDRRLAVATIPNELAEVVQTLDAMLARLEASFHRLSDFSSDLAHELRTPVSNLLTQTQVTLSRPRTLETYQDVLASNAEEFERLSRMIADMLLLAKADNALLIPHREPVDLAAEVSSLLEFYEAWADDKQLQLSQSGKATIVGDRLMLRRAIGNLLSNALRHTPTHGRIAVLLEQPPGQGARLQVENSGETLAAEHLPRLFDRFYRADAARHHAGEGAGLGLAITRSIVQAHGGEVAVRSEQGLTVFELRFPA
jgi:two-component system heavy metal sensor histidine kinase CusS